MIPQIKMIKSVRKVTFMTIDCFYFISTMTIMLTLNFHRKENKNENRYD